DHGGRSLGCECRLPADPPPPPSRSVRARDHSPKIGGPDAHAAGLRSQPLLSGQEERAEAPHHYHADGEDPPLPHLTAPSVAIDPPALPSLPLGAGYSPERARGQSSSRPSHAAVTDSCRGCTRGASRSALVARSARTEDGPVRCAYGSSRDSGVRAGP